MRPGLVAVLACCACAGGSGADAGGDASVDASVDAGPPRCQGLTQARCIDDSCANVWGERLSDAGGTDIGYAGCRTPELPCEATALCAVDPSGVCWSFGTCAPDGWPRLRCDSSASCFDRATYVWPDAGPVDAGLLGCEWLSEEDCRTRGCQLIRGQRAGDAGAWEPMSAYAGCRNPGPYHQAECQPALSCAEEPRTGVCWLFGNTCRPTGWAQSYCDFQDAGCSG